MDKLKELAGKTGVSPKEFKKLSAIKLMALLACVAAACAACIKNHKPAQPKPQPEPQKQTDAKPEKPFKSDGVGPWSSNYPAGTRYATVSVQDFR